MSLSREFKAALANALKTYLEFYQKKKRLMPPQRQEDVKHFTDLLKTQTYVIDLKNSFMAHYKAMSLPWYANVLFLADFSELQTQLKPILFHEKYSDEKLKDAYLRELIAEKQATPSESEREKTFQAEIKKLAQDVVKVTEQNEQLRLENIRLHQLNDALTERNKKLQALLKANNIPLENSLPSTEEQAAMQTPAAPLIFEELKGSLTVANQLLRQELKQLQQESR